MSEPLVSYIIPFYNACSKGRQQAWFEQCIESVLLQASYRDIELLLLDDGSSDHSRVVAEKYECDDRVQLITSNQNEGIAETLNRGLAAANGEFIARLDSDDAALPDRTAKQVAYLQEHPDVAVLGGGMRVIDTMEGTTTDVAPKALAKDAVRKLAKKECPFFHPTVMMRKSVYLARGGYPTLAYQYAEDYGYWVRILRRRRSTTAQLYHGANIPDILSIVRRHPNRISAQHYKEQCAAARLVSSRAAL